MGHTACDAIKGAMDKAELAHLTGLLAKIRPAVEATRYEGERSAKNDGFVDAVARKNVELTMADIRGRSPVLADLEAKGDYRQASDCLKQTVTSLHGAQRRERLGQATLPSVQSLAFLAACYAELGMFAEGRVLGEEGLQIAETVAHPSSLMWAAYGLGLLSLCKGDLLRALPLLERAMGICQEAALPLFVPRVAGALGAAYTLSGRVAAAVALL